MTGPAQSPDGTKVETGICPVSVLLTVRTGRSRRIALADLEAFVRSRRGLG